MGYNSRVYIVNKMENSTLGEVIARYECRGMADGFCELFTVPVDFDIYAEDGNTVIKTDCYGKSVKYAKFPEVIEWLERESEKEDYRRLKPLIGLLKGFDAEQWNDLLIVHYGH